MHEQPLALNRLELLLPSLARLSTKHQLRPERPLLRHVPLGLHLLVDNGVVVLKVSTEAFGFKRNPECKLVHGGGVLGPGGEVVRVDGELLLEGVDWVGVFEEEDLIQKVREVPSTRTCGGECAGRASGGGCGADELSLQLLSQSRVPSSFVPAHRPSSSDRPQRIMDGVLTVPYAALNPSILPFVLPN
jgi:hypothetical protein